MYRVIYEPQAEEDLVEIVLYYTLQGGFSLAETIEQRLKTSIASLKSMPYRCPKSNLCADERHLSIHKLPYRAYFLVNKDKKEVYILRILHTSRDQKAQLLKNN